jgi:hypothetical protein
MTLLVAALAVPAAAEAPKYGGTLTFMIPADAPPSFDGHRESTYATVHSVAPFYSVLIRVNPETPRRPLSSFVICAPRSNSRPTTARPTHSISARMSNSTTASGNAGWQRNLALGYGRVALIAMRRGVSNDALKGFRQGRDIIVRLMRRSPDNATLLKDLAWLDSELSTHDK